VTPVVAEPATVELPDPTRQTASPASATLPSWTDEVIAKTIEHNAKPSTPMAAPKSTQDVVRAEPKAKSRNFVGRVSRTYAGGGAWLLRANDGREYFLQGDEDVLRFRSGDQVEVTGEVTPSAIVGGNSIQVEKVSFTAKR
jgi:hypothetical protein